MDLSLTNLTPWPAALLPLTASDVAWTLIAKATFDVTPEGLATRASRALPLAVSDVPSSEDDPTAAARYETDFVPFKPRADCICVGNAYPPDGVATWCTASFGVGPYFEKQILVIGDRHWVPLDADHVGATRPAPFGAMPLTFANAYGGTDAAVEGATAFFAGNPSGKGYAVSPASAAGRPLPNLEYPGRRLRGWNDRVEPCAFAPVGRTWLPRLRRAGTYDEPWVRERAPRLPEDFDVSYYNAAPDDQQVDGYLRGDEEIRLTHLHPFHRSIWCRLPGIRMRAIVASAPPAGGVAHAIELRDVAANLDTLWVDAEALQLILVWRACIPAGPRDTHVLLAEERLSDGWAPLEQYLPFVAEPDVGEEPDRAEMDVSEADLVPEIDDEEG